MSSEKDSVPQRITVAPEATGDRLDQVLATAITTWSRSRLQKAIKDGRVTVDGEAVTRPSVTVQGGQEVSIVLKDERATSTDVRGRKILELSVVYEDDDLAVINKPAGLVTHPNPRQVAGTVSDLAVERYGPLPEVQGENRPGIVHRLDRLTSGLLVLGRTEAALQSLKSQFKARTIEKTYLAIVHGKPRFDTEWLTGAIASTPKNPDRMHVVPQHAEERLLATGEARSAETLLEHREHFEFASFVAAKPKTGRTHQIRVHLLAAGLPIVGDRVYRQGGAHRRPIPSDAPKFERPALHAHALAFDHPTTGERVRFEVEPPADMQAWLTWARDQASSKA